MGVYEKTESLLNESAGKEREIEKQGAFYVKMTECLDFLDKKISCNLNFVNVVKENTV